MSIGNFVKNGLSESETEYVKNHVLNVFPISFLLFFLDL